MRLELRIYRAALQTPEAVAAWSFVSLVFKEVWSASQAYYSFLSITPAIGKNTRPGILHRDSRAHSERIFFGKAGKLRPKFGTAVEAC